MPGAAEGQAGRWLTYLAVEWVLWSGVVAVWAMGMGTVTGLNSGTGLALAVYGFAPSA